jgi:predicted PurR-regulated permease PerM
MAAKGHEEQAPARNTNEPSAGPRVLLHMPVDVRSASLAFLAFAAGIALLRWMHEFIVPVLLGVVLSYALTPLVDRLQARRIPRMLGAALVLSLILGVIAAGGYALRHQADAFLTTLPAVAQQVRTAIAGTSGDGEGTLSKVQRAAKEIESAATLPEQAPAARAGASGQASSAASAVATAPPLTRIVVEKADLDVRGFFLSGTLGLAAFTGQTLVVLFVALFLLASGNTFRRKMVLLAGPRLSQRRITVQALDEVHTQIQRYLVIQVVTSLLVGVMTWIAFRLIGLNNSAVWGVVAAVANLIPYVGAIVISCVASIVGFVQFSDVHTGLLLGASSFVVHLIVGNLVTPWLTGKTSRMSPFVVFVGVLFFGWLWGVAGLVLAFPIMVTVKIVCDRVDDLKPLGQLLGA